MATIGDFPMPEDFRYKDVLLKGKPQHSKTDTFRLRHPSMDVRKRAKIFAPFDALKGYNEAVAAKNVLYEDKRELNEEDQDELNRRFGILHNLTYNSRMARANNVKITVTYYVPCSDENSEAYGVLGQYQQITGICWNVDAEVTQTIRVDKKRIRLADIRNIESETDIFDREWDESC